MLGRTLTPADDRLGAARVVVLSEGFWRERFGASPDALSSTMTLDGVAHEVVGVMPAGFELPHQAGGRIWTPLSEEEKADERDSQFLQVIGRLADGAGLESATARLLAVQDGLRSLHESQVDVGARTEPLLDSIVGDVRSTLWFLLGAVALVLLIACVNIANVLSVSALRRRQELAVRSALGAPGGRLIRGLMAESLLLAGMGGLLGILLARVLFPLLLWVVPSTVPRVDTVGIDGSVLLFGIAATFVTAVLVGSLPALHAASVHPGEMIRARGRGNAGDRSGSGLRSALVVTEVSLSFALMLGAGLLGQSFYRLWSVERGFEESYLYQLAVDPDPEVWPEQEDRHAFIRLLREELEAIPGATVTAANQVPLTGSMSSTSYHIESPLGKTPKSAWSSARCWKTTSMSWRSPCWRVVDSPEPTAPRRRWWAWSTRPWPRRTGPPVRGRPARAAPARTDHGPRSSAWRGTSCIRDSTCLRSRSSTFRPGRTADTPATGSSGAPETRPP